MWGFFFPSLLVFKSKCPCIGVSHCNILCNRRLACECMNRNGGWVFFCPIYVYDGGLLKTLYWHGCLPVTVGNYVHEDLSKDQKQRDPVLASVVADGDSYAAVILGDPAAIYSWVKAALLDWSKTVLTSLDLPRQCTTAEVC